MGRIKPPAYWSADRASWLAVQSDLPIGCLAISCDCLNICAQCTDVLLPGPPIAKGSKPKYLGTTHACRKYTRCFLWLDSYSGPQSCKETLALLNHNAAQQKHISFRQEASYSSWMIWRIMGSSKMWNYPETMQQDDLHDTVVAIFKHLLNRLADTSFNLSKYPTRCDLGMCFVCFLKKKETFSTISRREALSFLTSYITMPTRVAVVSCSKKTLKVNSFSTHV